MLAFKESNDAKGEYLLGGAAMPPFGYRSKLLVALEGKPSWSICLGSLASVDRSMSPFRFVSSFICTMSIARHLVLLVATQHVGSCVPVDRISNID